MSKDESLGRFGNTAISLSKNPLGIIALFIVLIHGFTSLVTAFGGSMTPYERIPLIYFLIVFPILVLGVFAWMVRSHSGKLFAPSDFKDEKNYIKMQMMGIASLSAATAKKSSEYANWDIDQVIGLVQEAISDGQSSKHLDHILWVDDRPNNNIYERQAFEAVGLRFTLALSTNEAMQKLANERFVAIISDMGRVEGPREGYVLLDGLRKQGNNTPLFFYASSGQDKHKRETADHGGQGCTNNPQELFRMVTRSVIRQHAA